MSPDNTGTGNTDGHRNPADVTPSDTTANPASPPPDNTNEPDTALGCTPAASDTNVVSTGTHNPPDPRTRVGCVVNSDVNDPSAFANVDDDPDRNPVTSTR